MSHSKISKTITHTVTLGSNGVGTTLTVTSIGSIAPALSGATAIYSALAGDELINKGAIQGGVGKYGFSNDAGTGGVGVDFAASGQILNFGAISGGAGGAAGQGFNGGAGGNGVDTAGATLANAGTIAGGAGGYSYGSAGGAGGIGVNASSSLSNSGAIFGGAGGGGGYHGLGGAGGIGVNVATGAALTNTGVISGGIGGYGDYGVGGVGGAGIYVGANGSVLNHGTISGGDGGGNLHGADGGSGAQLNGGSLTNTGTIAGGGGAYGLGNGGYGGAGGYLTGGATLTNNGLITGGYGGGGHIYGYGGGGGVTLHQSTLTNNGMIIGGGGSEGYEGGGGPGGAGVSIYGGSLTNTGTIAGGAGGGGRSYRGGTGGAGVYISGGTLVTSGAIIGGAGGPSGTGLRPGDAVQFGITAATLVVYGNASFQGNIVAKTSTADTLVLAAGATGSLSGFGTTITGFTAITEAARANWTLAGSISGAGSLVIGASAELTLNGAASIAAIDFAAGANETLRLAAPTQVTSVLSGFGAGDIINLAGLQATSLHYNGGKLTLYNASHTAIDTLNFAGTYLQSDFLLQANGTATELIYINAASHAPLPDFLPGATGGAESLHNVFDNVLGALHGINPASWDDTSFATLHAWALAHF